MSEVGNVAVTGDNEVTRNRAVRQMDERIRELESQFGSKTLEVEILKRAQFFGPDHARPSICGAQPIASPALTRQSQPKSPARHGRMLGVTAFDGP